MISFAFALSFLLVSSLNIVNADLYEAGFSGVSYGKGGSANMGLPQSTIIIIGVVGGGGCLILILAYFIHRKIQDDVQLLFNFRKGIEIMGSDGAKYFNDGNLEYYDADHTMHMVVGSNGVQYFAKYVPIVKNKYNEKYNPYEDETINENYVSCDGEFLVGKAYPADTLFDKGSIKYFMSLLKFIVCVILNSYQFYL